MRVQKAVVIMDVKVVVVNVTKLVLQIAIASHLIIARDPVGMIVIFVIPFVVRRGVLPIVMIPIVPVFATVNVIPVIHIRQKSAKKKILVDVSFVIRLVPLMMIAIADVINVVIKIFPLTLIIQKREIMMVVF